MTLSRRGLIGLGTLGVAGAGAAGAGALVIDRESPAAPADPRAPEPFYGPHQAGIVTSAQDRLHFVSLDVTTTDRGELRDLLRAWTAASARMTQGLDAGAVGAVRGPLDAPPDDTGEALGLPPARLTVTAGFGPALFDRRFGLSDSRPPALADLPRFAGDDLDAALTGGDLCLQACSDDPQVAVHAVRNLIRIGHGVVSVRWSQLGFGRTSATSRGQDTPRNLFGFKDGTANLRAEEGDLLERYVWAQPGDGPAWMTGGSYLVARRIRMTIENWDRTSLREQQAIVGRAKGSGAPLSGGSGEFDPPDFAATRADGEPVIPMDAHVRLAHPTSHAGERILRRGYSFVDGSDGLGRLDAGLFFIAFQRDPRRQFIPIQRSLARQDPMNEYIRHVGSAVFACPPGVPRPGGSWGEALFAT